MTILEKKLTNIAYYFEDIQPISETDGFKECLYSEPDNDLSYVVYSFYLYLDISDENYELFIEFLENSGFQNSKIIYSSMIEIIINIDKNKINDLSNKADQYLKSKKYNL